MKILQHSFFLLAVLLVVVPCYTSQFHVSPAATSKGDGSIGNPWTLQAAFGQPAAIRPGDTIWLHAGTYRGIFKSQLNGAPGKPILVRQYPGEHAAIDGGNSQQENIITVNGNYVWYWGFEVYSSDPVRSTSESGSFPSPGSLGRGVCINTTQDSPTVGNKFINLILHDGFNGFCAWFPANTELYGSILYNNGWTAPDRPHGHDIYVQNTVGEERRFIANIVWGAYENNVQAYGTRNTDDFYFERNAIFAHAGDGRNLLIGGDAPSKNPVIISNYLYDPSTDRNLDLGWQPYGTGIDHGTIEGNQMMGGGMYIQGPITNTTIAQNTIYAPGGYVGFSTSTYPNNSYVSTPTGVQVEVIPNVYEPGRGNIVIFNWNNNGSVAVDLSSVLNPGDKFEMRDAQNPFGTPVLSGRYSGGTVNVALTGLTAVSPIGDPGRRVHTAPRFAAFVVTRNGGFTTDVSSASVPPLLPVGFRLDQNFPNPFNPSTRIDFVLPEAGPATIKVFTILGTEVATLVSDYLSAGAHTTEWRPGPLASGVYFYMLTAGSLSETRRMVLMK